MRTLFVTTALAGALLGGNLLSASAQDGIVIQNNGVSSSDSAAGADNVNISQANGNSASNNGSGVNNEVRTLDREERTRERRDRSERTTEDVAEVAPAGEEWVPEETGAYDAYAVEGADWTEPVPDPDAIGTEVQPAPDSSGTLPIQLPNTGAGFEEAVPLAAFAAGAIAAACGSLSWRRRTQF